MEFQDSDYNDALLNATGQRNWLFLGLVLSLALHLLLCFYLYQTRFAPADLALAPKSEPPLFKVKPIDTQSSFRTQAYLGKPVLTWFQAAITAARTSSTTPATSRSRPSRRRTGMRLTFMSS